MSEEQPASNAFSHLLHNPPAAHDAAEKFRLEYERKCKARRLLLKLFDKGRITRKEFDTLQAGLGMGFT